MARQVLETRLSLDHLHRFTGGDEPYLWTVFFKIDGQTVEFGADGNLHGKGMIFSTPGSHGDLHNSLDAAGDVLVAPVVGEKLLSMYPIPLTNDARARFPGVDDVPGVLGVLAVVLQQHGVSDAGAEAGHAALNTFVEDAINGLIPQLGVRKQDLSDADLAAFADRAAAAVKKAIADDQGAWDNIVSYFDPDVLIGQHVFRFSHDQVTNNYWDLSQRFRHHWAGAVDEDWQIFGEAQGVVPGPRGYQHIDRTAEVGASKR